MKKKIIFSNCIFLLSLLACTNELKEETSSLNTIPIDVINLEEAFPNKTKETVTLQNGISFERYNDLTKVSHPLKHQLFSFSFVCLPPYPLTVNTCLTEVMQTIHILRPIFPTLQPLQGFCSSLCRFR